MAGCLALGLCHDSPHDLAHILHGFGTGLGDGIFHDLLQLVVAQLFRQVLFQYIDFLLVLFNQIRTIGILDLFDGIFSLLNFLHDDSQYCAIIQVGLFVYFLIPNGSPYHTQNDQPKLAVFPVFHGLLHIGLQKFS